MTDLSFAGDSSSRAKTVGIAIRTAVAGKGPLRLAIAYVSGDLKELLGIDVRRRSVTLLCDARSGACNPFVLRALAERANIRLLDVRGLHAKVMIGDAAVVIGSANASALALTAGTIEAVAVVHDDALRKDAIKWFDGLARAGSSLKSVLRREADFNELVTLWRRQQRPGTRKLTLLEAIEGGDPLVDDYVFGYYVDQDILPNKLVAAQAKALGERLPPTESWDRYEEPYVRGIERVFRRHFDVAGKKLITFAATEEGKRMARFVSIDARSAEYVSSFPVERTYQSNFLRVPRCSFDLGGTDAKELCRRLTSAVKGSVPTSRALHRRAAWILTAAEFRKLLASGSMATARHAVARR